MTTWGGHHDTTGFLVGFGVLVLLGLVVGLRGPSALRITSQSLEVTVRRRQVHFDRGDVADIAVRRIESSARWAPQYGVHILLRPDVPRPAGLRPQRDGAFLVWVTGSQPTAPPDLARALTRFAGP